MCFGKDMLENSSWSPVKLEKLVISPHYNVDVWSVCSGKVEYGGTVLSSL